MPKNTSAPSKPRITITITKQFPGADGELPSKPRKLSVPLKEIGTIADIIQNECSKLMRTPVDFVPNSASGVIQFVGTPRTDLKEAIGAFAAGTPLMLQGLANDIRDTALMLQLPLDAHREFGRIEVAACVSRPNAEGGLRLNRQTGKLEAARDDWESLHRRFATAAAVLTRLREAGYRVQISFDSHAHWLAAPNRDALRRHLIPGGIRVLYVQIRGLMPHDVLCFEKGSGSFDVEIQRFDCSALKEALYRGDIVRIEVSEQLELNPLLPKMQRFTLLKVEVAQGQLPGIDAEQVSK